MSGKSLRPLSLWTGHVFNQFLTREEAIVAATPPKQRSGYMLRQVCACVYMTKVTLEKLNTGNMRLLHEFHSDLTIPVLCNLERNPSAPPPLGQPDREQAIQALSRHEMHSWFPRHQALCRVAGHSTWVNIFFSHKITLHTHVISRHFECLASPRQATRQIIKSRMNSKRQESHL